MQKLIDGHRMFRDFVFPQRREFYRGLASGQKPSTLFMTCSDSRVQPTEIVSAVPGELFTDRSLGNIVPEPDGVESESQSIVEYAVLALGVSDLVVCGHTDCGAMKALLAPDSVAKLPSVAAWLRHAGPVLDNVRRKHGDLEGHALLDATIRENVLVQLEHVRSIPFIPPLVESGRLRLHGWVYNVGTGEVLAHDPQADRFAPLGGPAMPDRIA